MRRKQPPIVNESYWMKRMFGSSLEGRVRSAAPIAATAKPTRRTVGVTSESPKGWIFVCTMSFARPRGMGWDGTHLWIVTYTRDAHRVNLECGIDRTLSVPAANGDPDSWGSGITYDRANNELWVASRDTNSPFNQLVWQIDENDGSIISGGWAALGDGGSMVGLQEVGGNLWIVASAGDYLNEFVKDGTHLQSIEVEGGVPNIWLPAHDGTDLWAVASDGLIRVDSAGNIVETIDYPTDTEVGYDFGRARSFVWVDGVAYVTFRPDTSTNTDLWKYIPE